MIFDWLNSLPKWQARRVALIYFPAICWATAAIIVWGAL